MPARGSKMPRKKELAINALLTKGTIEGAAAACGLHKRTLRRWMRDPEFETAYRAARSQVLQQTIGLLSRASINAVALLLIAMNDEKTPIKHRLYAARSILEFAFRGTEVMQAIPVALDNEPILSQEEVLAAFRRSVGTGGAAAPPPPAA